MKRAPCTPPKLCHSPLGRVERPGAVSYTHLDVYKRQGYILSGHYTTIRGLLETVGQAAGLRRRSLYLPLWRAVLAAPFYEKKTLREKKPLFFTPYSISVLGSNGPVSYTHLYPIPASYCGGSGQD